MADLRFENKNNQKKEISVFASGELVAGVTGTLFTLPVASYVKNITKVDIVGADLSATVSGITANTYYPTGATVSLSVAPDAGTTVKFIVEYIETELTEGTYTD